MTEACQISSYYRNSFGEMISEFSRKTTNSIVVLFSGVITIKSLYIIVFICISFVVVFIIVMCVARRDTQRKGTVGGRHGIFIDNNASVLDEFIENTSESFVPTLNSGRVFDWKNNGSLSKIFQNVNKSDMPVLVKQRSQSNTSEALREYQESMTETYIPSYSSNSNSSPSSWTTRTHGLGAGGGGGLQHPEERLGTIQSLYSLRDTCREYRTIATQDYIPPQHEYNDESFSFDGGDGKGIGQRIENGKYKESINKGKQRRSLEVTQLNDGHTYNIRHKLNGTWNPRDHTEANKWRTAGNRNTTYNLRDRTVKK